MIDKTDILDFDKKYGFTQTPNILVMNMKKLGISGNEFAILTIIRMFAYQKDNSFPSIRTIKKISGMAISTVERMLLGLERKGYLVTKRSPRQNNLYSFKPLNDILEKVMFAEHNKSRGLNGGVPILDTGGVPILDTEEEKNTRIKIHTHTKNACEGEIKKQTEKIKKIKLYQNSEDWILKNQIIKYGTEEVLKAAKYLDEAYKNIQVKNPLGLLIRTLERGTYSELPPEKINNLNAVKALLNSISSRPFGLQLL